MAIISQEDWVELKDKVKELEHNIKGINLQLYCSIISIVMLDVMILVQYFYKG